MIKGPQIIKVRTIETGIYGVEWDGGPEPYWYYTDDAALFSRPVAAINNGNGSSPFDNIAPWSGMVREERTAGTMVKIPKYWYKWTRDGNKIMKLQITPYETVAKANGFFTAPAHADRGDGVGERDYVYIGAYHCSNTSSSLWKSVTGAVPRVNTTRPNARTQIHRLGSTIWQYDFAMYWTWAMLYLVEYGNWNAQITIGYGGFDSDGTRPVNSGLCDAMIYHTGTNAISRRTYGHVRYRYIEGLWSNVFQYIDGIYFSSSNIYCINNPSKFSDTSNGVKVGTRAPSSGVIRTWTIPNVSGYEYALFPLTVSTNGTYDTYICDRYNHNSTGTILYSGSASKSLQQGAFNFNGDSASDVTSGLIGARVMELP